MLMASSSGITKNDLGAENERNGNDLSLEVLYESLSDRIRRCRRCEGLNRKGVTESAPGFGSLFSKIMIIGQSL
jgi:DNA polymerase